MANYVVCDEWNTILVMLQSKWYMKEQQSWSYVLKEETNITLISHKALGVVRSGDVYFELSML